MSFDERLWDGFRAVIKMEDRVDSLTDTVKSQQSKIEDLTERIIRQKPHSRRRLRSKGQTSDEAMRSKNVTLARS